MFRDDHHGDDHRGDEHHGVRAIHPGQRGLAPYFLMSLLLLLLQCALPGCSGDDRGSAFGGIEGRAVFMGPVANAPVTLVRLEEGRVIEAMASGRTDADGRFVFRPLVADTGRYRVVVELAGLPWSYRGRSGVHPPGTDLSATLTDYGRYAEREVSVSAFTTLADALSDTLRRVDSGTDAEERARAGFIAHLEIDPAQAQIGEPLGDIAREPTRHRLLVDAFDVLCDQLGESAGRPAEYFHPGQVLAALVEDARGTEPSGRFDGLGPTGPVFLEAETTPLDPEALRAHLAASVLGLVATDPRWATVTAAAVTPIVRHLTCSPSSLFPACDANSAADRTPPIIQTVDPPPGTPLVGVVDIRVQANEPDGTLARVELTRLVGARREPVAALPGPGHVFRIDTRALQGVAQLDAEVRAVNAAGLETRLPVSWPLSDREVGVLRGFVYKGRARRALVEAFDVAQPPILLGSAVTDDEGAFALQIVTYAGPVRLVVSDDRTATSGLSSVYDDEVRGERRWRTGRTLQALVPEFRSAVPLPAPVIITPFADMALAYADRINGNGGLLVSAYEEAAAALAGQLGLESSAQALLFTHPARTDVPVLDFEGAERLAFALGCFSAQAQALGTAQLGTAADDFDALDLVALYRLDLEADGLLDGRTGSVAAALPVGNGEVRSPPDPLRTDFVAACARWQQHPANRMAIEDAEAVRHLQRLTRFAEAPLYDPTQSPPVFDEAPPTVRLTAEVVSIEGAPAGAVYLSRFPTATEAETGALPPTDFTTVRGAVALVLDVTDPSGIGALSAQLVGLGGGRDGGELVREDLSPTHSRVSLVVDAARLDDRRHALDLVTTDLLGNTVRERRVFVVDNTPPTVDLDLLGEMFNAVGDRTYTAFRAPAPLEVTWNDLSGVAVRVELGGDVQLDLPNQPGDGRQTQNVDFAFLDEGEHTLTAEVVDLTGLRTSVSQVVVVDRRPPVFSEVATDWYDEAKLPPDRDPTGLAAEHGVTEGRRTVRRWQTAWGPDASLPAQLAFDLRDAEGPGQSPPEGVRLRLSVCLSNSEGLCNPGAAAREFTVDANDPTFTLTAGPEGPDEPGPRALPFDPIADPPRPGHFAVRLNDVTDLAGNRLTLDTVRVFQHQVVAPALDITVHNAILEAELPANMVSMEHLSITGGDLADLVRNDSTLHLHRIRVHNPHVVPVALRVRLPASYRMTSVVQERFDGVRYTLGFNQTITDCETEPGAPAGSLGRRPVDASRCAIDEVGDLEFVRCRTCLPTPTAPQMARMNRLLSATANGHLQGEAGTVPGSNAAGARSWTVNVSSGATRTLDLGLSVGASAGASPVHTSRDVGGHGESALPTLPHGYHYRPAGALLTPWLEGSAYLAVTNVSLAPEFAADTVVGSFLFDQLTHPISIQPMAPATTER